MVKYIVVLSLLIALSVQNGCKCPGEQLYNKRENTCVDVNSHPEWQQVGCQEYQYNSDYTKLVCQKCQPSYYFNYLHQTCTQTGIKHCANIQRWQEYQGLQLVEDVDMNQTEFIYKCRVCEDGYYLQSYNNCVPNPSGNDQGYQPNCERYLTSDKCQYCENGYYLKDDACVEYPQKECKWYFWNKETQQGQCNQCIHNYYLKDNECVPYPTDNEGCARYAYKNQQTQCQFCDGEDGYVQVSKDSDRCSRIGDSISNCVRGTTEDKTAVCYGCQQGYFVNSDQNQCLQNPKKNQSGYVKNCINYYQYRYGHKLECSECESGYALDSTKRCVQGNIVENCGNYIYDYNSSSAKCSHCKFGYSGFGYYVDKCEQCPYQLRENYISYESFANQLLPGIFVVAVLFLSLV